MEYSICKMPRAVRRKLKKVVHNGQDKNQVRRANSLLLVYSGHNLSQVARILQSTRKNVREWCRLYRQFGVSGLVPESSGRPAQTVTEEVGAKLLELIEQETKKYNYVRIR